MTSRACGSRNGRFCEIVRDDRRFVSFMSLSRRQRRVLHLQCHWECFSGRSREGWELVFKATCTP
eukprot:6864747-Prymnesium_polylepis.1